jgi:hypothetical protein
MAEPTYAQKRDRLRTRGGARMMAASPLEEAIASVGDTTVSDELAILELLDLANLPEDADQLRFLVYVGLYDVLAEASLSALPRERDQEDLLARGVSSTIAAEPVLKFARHDRSSRVERLESSPGCAARRSA